MNKILLIGNSGLKHHSEDGQTIKVRLYLKKMLDEGFEVQFVDLEGFLKHAFTILGKIRRGIKDCNRIVLLSAERGCKYLIPYINRHNKKHKKPFILPLIGISVLHNDIDTLSIEKRNLFLTNHNYSLVKKNNKMSKQLQKIDYILPETDLLAEVFKEYYSLENVYTLSNFRESNAVQKQADDNKILKIVFLSRVISMKGIFDIMSAVSNINSDSLKVELDIYGRKSFDAEEEKEFKEYLQKKGIKYLGLLDNSKVVDAISHYNIFALTYKACWEGKYIIMRDCINNFGII